MYYTQILYLTIQPNNEVPPPTNVKISSYPSIGEGTFGKVYLAQRCDTGDQLVVKQIRIDEAKPEMVEQFLEEVRVLSRLEHPNIVRYLGATRKQEHLNIYLEYMAGGSLASMLKRYGPFPEPLIRRYTKQILEGLEYLHYREIIHRDLKGANILVTKDGVCKIADFGTAKQIMRNEIQKRSFKGTFY